MKMLDEISRMGKEHVYEQYTRIVEDVKEYEKITNVKMLEAIYKVYDNPDNIIDLCTTRELKYLKMVLDNKAPTVSVEEIAQGKDKHIWEVRTLRDKFLLNYKREIPEEVRDSVRMAIKKVDFSKAKQKDELNEFLVSYCKMQGSVLLDSLCQFAKTVTGVEADIIREHVLNNKLFNYYVLVALRRIEGLKKDFYFAILRDYVEMEDELDKQKQKYAVAGSSEIDLKIFKTLFYNDFDINNSKIKKFLNEYKKLPFSSKRATEMIKEYAMLNIDRGPLKEEIKNIPSLRNIDLTKFFKLLDDAMDEMPSGALNGYTPNETKVIKMKQITTQINKAKRYVKQRNACLSKKDKTLFYKIYFGLLEFTNKKYKVNEHIKIYKQKGIIPQEIASVVDVYWKNKEEITNEFCLTNPYKFSKEELNIASEFKKGIRTVFIIARYEQDYTAFMTQDKVYMVKGLNDNMDNIVPYNELPYVTVTSIIPYKGNLVYDGILLRFGIELSSGFDEVIDKEYDSSIKYYHL